MAAVKLEKGTEPFQMFTDFWRLCQLYGQPESGEKYWSDMNNDFTAFVNQYEELDGKDRIWGKLARQAALGFMKSASEIYQGK